MLDAILFQVNKFFIRIIHLITWYNHILITDVIAIKEWIQLLEEIVKDLIWLKWSTKKNKCPNNLHKIFSQLLIAKQKVRLPVESNSLNYKSKKKSITAGLNIPFKYSIYKIK